MLLLPIDGFDDGVGEGLPAEALVRAGLPGTDGERSIEEQDALLRPFQQAPVGDDRGMPQVGGDLLLDILKARRDSDTRGDGEGKSFGLPRSVVRVLPEDHHPHLGQRAKIQRTEDHPPRRVDRPAGAVFATYLLCEDAEVELIELGG